MFTRKLMGAVAALLFTWPVAADAKDYGHIKAVVAALDGDTLLILQVIDNKLPQPLLGNVNERTSRIRLWGIDTPEMGERDGWYARGALDDLLAVSNGIVTCAIVDTDRSRLVGVCEGENPYADTAGNEIWDLAARLLITGWAVTYRTFTHRRAEDARRAGAYDFLETQAREDRLGFWSRMP